MFTDTNLAFRQYEPLQQDVLIPSPNAFTQSDNPSYPRTRGQYADSVHAVSSSRHSFPTSPRHLTTSHGHPSLPGVFPNPQYREGYQNAIHDYSAHQDLAFPSFAQLRRNETLIQTSALVPSFLPEPTSATTATSSSQGDDSEAGTPTPLHGQPPPKPRKTRREKPHIELAPDQPPTTQGKPRCRVYVACVQCRNRKIRCDGAKPVCHNCSRRTSSGECSYDATPKRRGPDKTPGARQRMARDLRTEIENDLPLRRRRRKQDHSAISGTPNGPDKWDKIPVAVNVPVTAASVPLSASHPIEDYRVLPIQNDENCRPYLADHVTRHLPQISIPYNNHDDFDPLTSAVSSISNLSRSYSTTEEDYEYDELVSPDIGAEPSIDFTRKIWWDSLLSLHSSSSSSSSRQFVLLTASQREMAVRGITSDLRFLFRVSNYWFQFFHIPSFFSNYFDLTRREQLQPSLILAALALSTFWQSPETGNGRPGRERALRFREEAQGAMEASFNAGWIDETLAQAAWLLALFEVCAHPLHSSQRSNSSMLMLDSIIRSLALTSVDADDPHASIFTPRRVPAVTHGHLHHRTPRPPHSIDRSNIPRAEDAPSLPVGFFNPDNPSHGTTSGCSCILLTLGHNSRSSKEHTPMWAATPAWNDSWSEAEIRKESCRRLCWSAMQLAAGHINYTSVTSAPRSTNLDLFVSDPANYAILFSGESITRSPSLTSSQSSKDTVWALYDRAFLLWHGCMRMRHDPTATDTEKAQFGVNAWLEADALEHALNKHTCGIERTFVFQGREYLFNTRMCISYEYQRFIPLVTTNASGLFNRKKAEEWLTHQATVATRFIGGLHHITGMANNVLARRPFFVFWFMGQVSRALALWACDHTMTIALHVCKAFLAPIDYLSALWPCKEQRLRYERLLSRLNAACYAAGLPPVPPPNLALSGDSEGVI